MTNLVNTAKLAVVKRSILPYNYAVTLKPMTLKDRNSEEAINLCAKSVFQDTLTNVKWELDKRNILHIHALWQSDYPTLKFAHYRKQGFSVYIKRLHTIEDKEKWLNYLTKGDPSEQVLIRNYFLTKYSFINA